MSQFDLAILSADATQIKQWFEAGELLPQEYFSQLIEYSHTVEPKINAFISFEPSLINEELSSCPSNRSLSCLPIAIKDNIDVTGYLTTAGMKTRQSRIAKKDSFVVQQLETSGAIIYAKLNMHEAALGATNNNPHYGACHNPHRLGYTPGGSSGGSAAAVASLQTPLSLGTDTMGSVRIPSAYCGVCGFKPSFGTVSPAGTVAVSKRFDHIGPIARSVRDLMLVFNVIRGFDENSAQSLNIDLRQKTIGPYLIGFVENIESFGVNSEIARIYYEQLKCFQSMGHQLRPIDLSDFDFAKTRRAGLLLCESEMLYEHQQDLIEQQENFSPELIAMLEWVDSKSIMDSVKAEDIVDKAIVKSNQIFSQVNFLCLPTTLQTAFSFETTVPANQADFTSFANMSGIPAVSVPTNEFVDGLPTAIQLLGEKYSDENLLALAEDYHQVIQYHFTVPKTVMEYMN